MGTPVQFKLKSGTTSEWNLANPTLLQGEPGVDISKNILKIGTGGTTWGSLPSIGFDSTTETIAIGYEAGQESQNAGSVAIGGYAGQYAQGMASIAIGYEAGNTGQGVFSVAIGNQAGQESQGDYSIAIGWEAGQGFTNFQPANTIILNASGTEIDGVSGQTGSFYVAPVRGCSGGSTGPLTCGSTDFWPVWYSPSTQEFVYFTNP